MIQYQVKLKLNKTQEKQLLGWLWNLTAVWNWGIRKIELNAKDKIYFSEKKFQNLLANHSKTLEIPSHTIQGVLLDVHDAWSRCFKGLANKPKLKGICRPLNSISFVDPIKIVGNKVGVPGIGKLRFHKQFLLTQLKSWATKLVFRESANFASTNNVCPKEKLNVVGFVNEPPVGICVCSMTFHQK
jgi:hypothetical protein